MAVELLGLRRACRDLEDDHEPVTLVALLADARETEARDGGQGGVVVGPDTGPHSDDGPVRFGHRGPTKRTLLGMERGSLFIAEMLAQHQRAVHRITASADMGIVVVGP
ncbi:hypothetical protein [Streptomyces sp. NPDC051364]|uniref:hypothetical protein n=1 Tax=Streptomyces sp. NPDC051364 TaxID=3155799 RepID=UPI003448E678